MEQFAISANFKSAAARRNERERFDAFAEFKNFGRQTDGLRRVVSNYTIFDRDFRFHPARSFPQKWYGAGRNRSRVVKREDRSDAPRAVLNSHSTPHTRRGAPFDLHVKFRTRNSLRFGSLRNCSLSREPWTSGCEWTRALRRRLPRRVHRRQSNRKRRRTIPLRAICGLRRTTVKYRAVRCAASSRQRLVQ